MLKLHQCKNVSTLENVRKYLIDWTDGNKNLKMNSKQRNSCLHMDTISCISKIPGVGLHPVAICCSVNLS